MLKSVILFIIIATMLVVLVGSVFMIIGGKKNKKYGNKLMVLRVTLQALAIFMLFLFYTKA